MAEQQGKYITEKKVDTGVSGFTPCPDILVKKYSHTTALIWGKIWRHCQMQEEVCRASIQRLATELNLTEDTISKHIKLLEDGKYIKDLTPERRNRPHEYVDTEKIRLKIQLMMEESTTENLGSDYLKNRHEESTTTTTNLFSVYESNIGPITTMIADSLQDAEKTYPVQWIVEAIKLSVENNKRNWRYCETILDRWKRDGKDNGKNKPKQSPQSSPAIPDLGDLEARYGI